MIKFCKVTGTEIHEAVDVDEQGNKTVVAVILSVKELLEHKIIFEYYAIGNMEKWLVIVAGATDIWEYDTLDDAKLDILEALV